MPIQYTKTVKFSANVVLLTNFPNASLQALENLYTLLKKNVFQDI